MLYTPYTGRDLCILSLMDHTILTYGTFGMWGALLNGGTAVLPPGYQDTVEMREIDKANINGWTVLE